MQSKTRNFYIDAIKGICIIMIVLFHNDRSFLPEFLKLFFNSFGKIAVSVLFVLSMYLGFESLERSSSIQKWYLKKYIRLAPLYYLSLIVSSFLTFVHCAFSKTIYHISIKTVLCELLMLNCFISNPNSIMGIEWFVGTLVIMILLIPLCKNLYEKLNLQLLVILFFISIPLTMLLYKANLLIASLLLLDTANYYYNWIFLPIRLFFIPCAYISFKLSKSTIPNKFKLLSFLISILLILFSVYVNFGIFNFYILGIASIFLILSISNANNINVSYSLKFLCIVGKHSYSIYLFHLSIIRLWQFFIFGYFLNLNSLFINILGFIFTLFSSILLGCFLDKYFDSLIQKKLRYLF